MQLSIEVNFDGCRDETAMNTTSNDPARHDPQQARRDYLCLSEADARRLRSLRPQFQADAETFVEQFYQHLQEFESTAKFLRDPELVERLKKLQLQHFDSLFAAEWDENYVEQRRRVGRTHAELGVEPEFFLGAYQQIVDFCFGKFACPECGDPEEWKASFTKVVLYDIGLTLDAYFQQMTSNLRSALELYWRANSELRQFARFASHDLKTPLATVANLCDEALDEFGEEMPAGARELVAAAQERTLRMSKLIDELLSVSITAHEPDSLEEIPSEGAILEAVDRVRPQLKQREIELHLPDQYPYVWGNSIRLREAFYNLLSNAVKFSEAKPGSINLSVETNERCCTFCLHDNGPGIPQEELERIFAPFRRLPQHRHRPGSGLGLYFTKNLIEEQGGRIWAESEPGQGSRFYIQLSREPSNRRAYQSTSEV